MFVNYYRIVVDHHHHCHPFNYYYNVHISYLPLEAEAIEFATIALQKFTAPQAIFWLFVNISFFSTRHWCRKSNISKASAFDKRRSLEKYPHHAPLPHCPLAGEKFRKGKSLIGFLKRLFNGHVSKLLAFFHLPHPQPFSLRFANHFIVDLL